MKEGPQLYLSVSIGKVEACFCKMRQDPEVNEDHAKWPVLSTH